MRLIVTNGERAVDVRVKGSGPKALRNAERAVRRLWRASAAPKTASTLPFGFAALSSDLQLAVGDEEEV